MVSFQLDIIDSSNSLRFDNLSLAAVIFFILLYPVALTVLWCFASWTWCELRGDILLLHGGILFEIVEF